MKVSMLYSTEFGAFTDAIIFWRNCNRWTDTLEEGVINILGIVLTKYPWAAFFVFKDSLETTIEWMKIKRLKFNPENSEMMLVEILVSWQH